MKNTYKNFQFHIVDENEFSKLMKEKEGNFYDEVIGLNYSKIISDNEKKQLRKLNKNYSNNLTLCIKITDNSNSFVGWCYGDQFDQLTFTMHSSFIDLEFRRQGIYSAVLDFVLDWAKTKGFLKVISNHSTNNNSIIIPKLKKGFVIQGLELNERFGMTVNLVYFFNNKLKDINEFRVGSKRANDEILDCFN